MSYKIPLFDLNFDDSEINAVVDTLKSNWISTGPKCKEFEDRFAELLDIRHAISLSNCTTALHLALDTLGIKEGDEVICPSLTFVASVNAIRYVNAVPIFCDVISPENLNLDPNRVEQLITPKTKAIVVVHFAGFPCEMREILDIAKRYDLKIIEDACHGPLSEYNGKKLGTLGDVGCFSFFSNKNISTGEGGMIVTDNPTLAEKIRLKRSHGMTTMSYQRATGHSTAYDVVELGYNYRMDDLRASIGLVQLTKIQKDLERRSVVRRYYEKHLTELNDLIWIPFQANKNFVSNYIFPIVLKNSTARNRDDIRSKIHELGIQTSVHYPAAHRFAIYSSNASKERLENTEYISDNEITLPMYGNLTDEDVRYIADSLKAVLS